MQELHCCLQRSLQMEVFRHHWQIFTDGIKGVSTVLLLSKFFDITGINLKGKVSNENIIRRDVFPASISSYLTLMWTGQTLQMQNSWIGSISTTLKWNKRCISFCHNFYLKLWILLGLTYLGNLRNEYFLATCL